MLSRFSCGGYARPNPNRSTVTTSMALSAYFLYRYRPAWAYSDHHTPLALLSAHAFKVLGDLAPPVVLELSILAADTNNPGGADMALTALAYMGFQRGSAFARGSSQPLAPVPRPRRFHAGPEQKPWAIRRRCDY